MGETALAPHSPPTTSPVAEGSRATINVTNHRDLEALRVPLESPDRGPTGITRTSGRTTRRVALVAEMHFDEPEDETVYFCPMHPEVVSAERSKGPKCAMKLMPPTELASAGDAEHAAPAGHEHAKVTTTPTPPGRSSGTTTWSRGMVFSFGVTPAGGA